MARKKNNEKVKLLSNVALFSSCTDRELARIGSLADEIEAEAGDVLTKEGRVGFEFYVIADGIARASIKGRKLADLGPGDFFGEMALLDPAPRSATVRAQTDMRLYALSARDFDSLLRDVPAIARKMLKSIAKRLRDQEQSPTH